MILTVSTIIENGTRRADAPDPHTLVEDMGDTMRVRLPDTPEVEQWAVEQGYHVPESITPRQARLVLLSFGLLDQIEAAMAAIEDPAQRKAAQIEWEFASEVRRTHPLVQAFAQQLGWDSEQIDQLMIQGYLIGG